MLTMTKMFPLWCQSQKFVAQVLDFLESAKVKELVTTYQLFSVSNIVPFNEVCIPIYRPTSNQPSTFRTSMRQPSSDTA